MLQCFTLDNHLSLLSQFPEWMARSLMFFFENFCIWHILVSSRSLILTALEEAHQEGRLIISTYLTEWS
jgi:hypothetical protein